jgi:ABC-2 type transport system ATP-binding protein
MVQINNFSFGYTKKKILYNNLTLTLEKGKIYGMLGKNGAGKSTFLKNLSGLLFPTNGNIFVSGQEPKRRLPSFLENIYFIPEEVYVPSISIDRYTKLFSPFYPQFSKMHFLQYLEMLEVDYTARLKSLSFGQQKKFIIAFALACNTPLLLLDEPTNGLDIPSKAQFRRLIASVMSAERIIFISTHQTRDLENLIDTVLIIDNGELLLNASMEQINRTLSFKTLGDIPADGSILFSEKTFGGYFVVMENMEREDNQLNLELLFNTVILKPDIIKNLFSPLNTDK